MDNVGIVVESLDAAVSFFAELGLELEGRTTIEGEWAGRVTGLGDQRVEIAMMRTPDGHGRIELSRFLAPPVVADHRNAPVNALPALPYDHRSSLACSVGNADAAVPVAFTLTNATGHASVGLGADVGLYSEPVLNLSRIKFDAMVGKTPRCITTTAANAALYTALWDRPHGPGESERDDLYVVVPGYYSAAHPDGNRPFLHALELGIFLYANGHVPGHDRFRGAIPPRESFIRVGK